jgi:hypothetical protein
MEVFPSFFPCSNGDAFREIDEVDFLGILGENRALIDDDELLLFAVAAKVSGTAIATNNNTTNIFRIARIGGS